jgi:hypothetical protein
LATRRWFSPRTKISSMAVAGSVAFQREEIAVQAPQAGTGGHYSIAPIERQRAVRPGAASDGLHSSALTVRSARHQPRFGFRARQRYGIPSHTEGLTLAMPYSVCYNSHRSGA